MFPGLIWGIRRQPKFQGSPSFLRADRPIPSYYVMAVDHLSALSPTTTVKAMSLKGNRFGFLRKLLDPPACDLPNEERVLRSQPRGLCPYGTVFSNRGPHVPPQSFQCPCSSPLPIPPSTPFVPLSPNYMSTWT